MPQPRYDRFSVFLHWLMAVLIVGQVALGLWMTGLPKDGGGLRAAWFNVHKSWGMVLGLLIALRLAWALLRPRVGRCLRPGRCRFWPPVPTGCCMR